MPLAKATVEFVPLRNDLANLPQNVANMLFTANIYAQEAVVEVELLDSSKSDRSRLSRTKEESRRVYIGWTGLSSAANNTIEIDPTVASTLGIRHGQSVQISVMASTPLAHTIHLEPATPGDWEIMETHVAFLETYMINQVRAVREGQPITVFPSPTALATLNVTKIVPPPPSTVARISPTSEVIVAPKTHDTANSEKSVTLPAKGQSKSHQSSLPSGIVTRVSVHPYLKGLDSRELYLSGMLPSGYEADSTVLVSLAAPPTLATNANSGEEVEYTRAKTVYATYRKTNSPIAGISYGLGNALGLLGDAGIGAKVYVRPLGPDQRLTSSISATLHPYTLQTGPRLSSSAASRSSQLTSEEISSLDLKIVGKGLVVSPLDSILPFGGIIETDSKEWGSPSKIMWGAETPIAESKRMKPLNNESQSSKKRPLAGRDDYVRELSDSLVAGSGILLHGSRGCGKSVLIDAVVSLAKQKHIKPLHFKCGNYAEKALPTVRDALKKISLEAQWYSPSVVVFDDFDKLIPAQQEHSSDSLRHQQLAEVFKNIWSPLIASGSVSVITSAQDKTEVNSYLLSSHILDHVKHLKSPDKDLREAILRTAIESMGLEPAPSLDLIEVVGETEGYQPGDLWILVERLSSLMALSSAETIDDQEKKQHSVVTADAILSAATDFTPASLRGVKLEKPDVRWDDVGGLESTKNILLETLEWPTKYAPIFANCPLRLRSGILLYGYPGCGKTMLASAIASKTGLNFISVKGPEILNKYIGASEQSVRDLFDRAQAAKPCVLFFDEFDSVAPKRGHDATGVTDRVVNQLLTQMDGAEGLDGVYVLAATSRPDMIDSALLRPGRLDKSVLCGMPDIDDRRDIILRAASKLSVAPDVDIEALAAKAERFSGADLQALVYNAYLDAVHDTLNKQQESTISAGTVQSEESVNTFLIGPGDAAIVEAYARADMSHPTKESTSGDDASSVKNSVIITAKNMNVALKGSKPSISPQEYARFQSIYAEFSTDRNGEMPPGISSNEIGGRVTLQ